VLVRLFLVRGIGIFSGFGFSCGFSVFSSFTLSKPGRLCYNGGTIKNGNWSDPV